MYEPVFKTPLRVSRLLEQLAELRERIRSSLIRVPWVPSLVADAMARLAWGSTAIEGCTLSLEAIQGLLRGQKAIGYPDRHVRMAQNYLNALKWIQKNEKIRRIGEKDLFPLHKIIGEGAVDDGPVPAFITRCNPFWRRGSSVNSVASRTRAIHYPRWPLRGTD